MDSLQAEVYAALSNTGYPVSYFYPQDGFVLPQITFYESDNREFGQADGNEYITEVEYTVDLWALSPEITSAMALLVDTAMSVLRLKRTFSYDLYEQDTRVHHKNMRYRGLIHIAEQKIYQ